MLEKFMEALALSHHYFLYGLALDLQKMEGDTERKIAWMREQILAKIGIIGYFPDWDTAENLEWQDLGVSEVLLFSAVDAINWEIIYQNIVL